MRELAPTLPLLIPGVGAQGGDAQATVQAGWRPDAPVIVSSSRAVLYASSGSDFASAARAGRAADAIGVKCSTVVLLHRGKTRLCARTSTATLGGLAFSHAGAPS